MTEECSEKNVNVAQDVELAQKHVQQKLIITNLPHHFDDQRLMRVLKRGGVEYVKCKKVHGAYTGSVWFKDEAERAASKSKVEEAFRDFPKVRVIECEQVNARRLQRIQDQAPPNKRCRESADGDCGAAEGVCEAPESVNDVVAPKWKMEYSAQLEEKGKEVRKTLIHIMSRIRKSQNGVPLVRKTEFANSGEVIPAPHITGYRNKLSFSIGTNAAGERVVGFSAGAYGRGNPYVMRPEGCVLVSPRMEEIRAVFEKEVIEKSPLPVYDKHTHGGFWRQLELREFTTGQVLATFQVNSTVADSQTAASEKTRAAAVLAGPQLHIDSVYVQENASVSNSCDDPPTLLQGTDAVEERVLGLRFRVSSGSFFQTNTPGMERLYTAAANWCSEAVEYAVRTRGSALTDVLLLDVCCGTGTIGQVVAKTCFAGPEAAALPSVKIIGIDTCPEAIQDAKANYELNAEAFSNVHASVQYVAGKAEDCLRDLTDAALAGKQEPPAVFAVVDPPRCGLHPKVLKALRSCRLLTHLVYVSCSPASLANDAEMLCRPESKSMHGEPFFPLKALGVDMFPHTEHLEMVMLFVRKSLVDKDSSETETSK